MKILIVSNNMDGLYSFRKEVVKSIRDLGHEVYISVPISEKSAYFEALGCTIIDTEFNRKGTNPIKDFGLMLLYRRLIKMLKPNVMLSYTIKPNLYGGMACRLCGIPQIANITGLGTAVENTGWLQKLTFFLYKIGLRKTQMVFFQNKANMVFCEKHSLVCGDRQLIPGSGVNLQYHSIQDYPEDGVIKFIFISRLLKEKGIEEYLGAASIIKERYPNTEFHILGSCEDAYEEQLNKLQKQGVVIYHGQQPDVRPFIGSIHCTIHPSYYPEGMSNVLLESCAAGRPIITTDRPGCGEIIDDKINGFVVKQQNVQDLVEKIENFIELPYSKKKEMGLASRSKVEKEFDRQIVVNAYLKEIGRITHV